MIVAVTRPITPPTAPLIVRSSHSPTFWATVPNVPRSDSTVTVGVWNGSLPSNWLTRAMALSPSALTSAVLAHSATPTSMCDTWKEARVIKTVIGMTTVARAAKTVSVVDNPTFSLVRIRLYSGVNR